MAARTPISFFFYDTATTEIYTLSLHDALPICAPACLTFEDELRAFGSAENLYLAADLAGAPARRSEEHTSELQSRVDLVCRLLLEKKNEDGLQHADVGVARGRRDRQGLVDARV